ncbi:MAG: DciA family protein [Pseudomonadota bacterium]
MKRINSCIPSQLTANIAKSTQLTAVVVECLPPQLRAAVECIGIKGDSLNLVADSAAVSNQLRFYHDPILRALESRGYGDVRRVACRTQPARGTPPKHLYADRRQPEPLSTQTRDLLDATAQSVDDPRLRAALQKLAKI